MAVQIQEAATRCHPTLRLLSEYETDKPTSQFLQVLRLSWTPLSQQHTLEKWKSSVLREKWTVEWLGKFLN